MSESDFYTILGVDRSASINQINRAFRRLALLYHPDVNKDEEASERFKQINQAHQTLSDTVDRSKYDLMLDEEYTSSFEDSEPNISEQDLSKEEVTAKNSIIIRNRRYWLRWLAVLPSSLMASIVLAIFLAVTGLISDGLLLRFLTQTTLGQLFSSCAFIVGGAYVAPEKKIETAIILAILNALVIGNEWNNSSSLEIGSNIAGLLLGLYITKKYQDRMP